MGRVKTAAIKKFSRELYQKHTDKFTSNFDENKKIFEDLATLESKKIKNRVVGYITKLAKLSSHEPKPEREAEKT